MNKKELTLSRLRNTDISEFYEELLFSNKISRKKLETFLTLGVLFLNSENSNIHNFGYKLILLYVNKTKDYRPLYDIAISNGYIPIAKFIEKKFLNSQNRFFNEFNSSYMENYKSNNIYLTREQKELTQYFDNNVEKNISVVAPTSYGKSDLIVSMLKKTSRKNICILVPTKALLSQTKKRILDAEIPHINKLIIYPEMFQNNNDKIVAILTQERLLRLLSKHKALEFDFVIVDEAHNLLNDDSRSILLASVITILEKRNRNTVFKFLTPFLIDSNNIKVQYSFYDINEYRIREYIKSEKVFLCDFRESTEKQTRKYGRLRVYEQFLNTFHDSKQSFKDEEELLSKVSGQKNIIYFNKPKELEKFALQFSKQFPKIKSKRIKKACKNLAKYLHPSYNMIKCLKRGVIYHHGAIPNQIRLYIEELYKSEDSLKYIVTNSTLLEGVNIPAENLFLMENKKGLSLLSSSQFKNLIGRVSRFSEVFSDKSQSMEQLEPKIYVIGSSYISLKSDLETFLKKRLKIDAKIEDKCLNVLLKNTEINEKNIKKKREADEFIRNFEDNVIINEKIPKAQSELAERCFLNNIVEVDILKNEVNLNNKFRDFVDEYRFVKSGEEFFEALSSIFLPYIKDNDKYENLKRLTNTEAKSFYNMFLTWRIESKPYHWMVSSFLYYWKKFDKKSKNDKDKDKELPEEKCIIYIGRWGDMKREGFRELWTNIRRKSRKERINLAIVKIHEEIEFLDNVIIKFLEVLNDMNIVEETFYNKIKYGTANKESIIMIKNGFSYSLALLIIETYREYIYLSIETETFRISEEIIFAMEKNKENEVLIYELRNNIKTKSKK